jgi:hypothetical protein
MKKLLLILPMLAAAQQGYAQGYVVFASVTQDLSVEKRIADITSSQYLDGTFVAQLYAGVQGTIENALTVVDSPVYFLGSPPESLGEFLGNELQISGVGVGSTGTFQVRVWPALYANWTAAYNAALADPSVHVGKSATFNMATGALNAGTEIASFMPLFSAAQLIPEPSAVTLGLLGVGLTFLRRKTSRAA